MVVGSKDTLKAFEITPGNMLQVESCLVVLPP